MAALHARASGASLEEEPCAARRTTGALAPAALLPGLRCTACACKNSLAAPQAVYVCLGTQASVQLQLCGRLGCCRRLLQVRLLRTSKSLTPIFRLRPLLPSSFALWVEPWTCPAPITQTTLNARSSSLPVCTSARVCKADAAAAPATATAQPPGRSAPAGAAARGRLWDPRGLQAAPGQLHPASKRAVTLQAGAHLDLLPRPAAQAARPQRSCRQPPSVAVVCARLQAGISDSVHYSSSPQ